MNKTLKHDVDLDNAIFFGQYVMVLTDGKMTGGGIIESYDNNEIQINGKRHSRKSTLIQTPPPDSHFNF